MTLSRRQKLALLLLAAGDWTDHAWPSIDAALVMFGETRVNGHSTAGGLVRKGLAARVSIGPSSYQITPKGLAHAALIEIEGL